MKLKRSFVTFEMRMSAYLSALFRLYKGKKEWRSEWGEKSKLLR